jgi:hypothetical protein
MLSSSKITQKRLRAQNESRSENLMQHKIYVIWRIAEHQHARINLTKNRLRATLYFVPMKVQQCIQINTIYISSTEATWQAFKK